MAIISTVHSVLHLLRDSRTAAASSNNSNSNQNNAANSRSEHSHYHDESIMMQILRSQQRITDCLVHSNEISASAQRCQDGLCVQVKALESIDF